MFFPHKQLTWLAFLVLLGLVGVIHGDTLDDIQARARLIVGVKADVPAFGNRNPETGAIEGLEPDLARDLAQRLGVELELVPVVSAERITKLENREVDVILATLNETPERRERLTLVAPSYYASGASVLARRTDGFRDWSELRNRRMCSRRGSSFNRRISVTYGADIVALYSADHALRALREGRCDGFLGDTAMLSVLLQDPELGDRYEMTLPPLYSSGWAVAMHKSERGGRFETFVSDTIKHWHATGLIGDLEDRWGIPRSGFSRRMADAFSDPPPDRGQKIAPRPTSTSSAASPDFTGIETWMLPQDMARLLASGEIIVAMTAFDLPPFYYEIDGHLRGLDVALARDLAKELGVAPRFHRGAATFNEVVDLVARQEADIGISKLSRTLTRAKKVRFSRPYLSLKHALVLNRTLVAKMAKDQPFENVVRDFRGSLGVLANSSYADFARRNFPHARVSGYDAWQDAVADLIAGDVAALYRDDFEIKRVLQTDKTLSLTLRTVTLTDLDDDVGIAVGADDLSLLAFIDMFLEKRPKKLSVDDVLSANEVYQRRAEAADGDPIEEPIQAIPR